ncbi:MAG TPA: DUF6580 family putative transport protein [Terriglobia bacterium]|nr:DUF6580 family putative transport protein [Terriglobia bacterium]
MVIYLYVLGAVLFRLIPHPWNVTPLAAMFLFSGATFRSKGRSLLVPLIALLVSDYTVDLLLYHGVYHWFSPFTWAGFLLVGMLGWTLRGKWNWARVGGASVAASTIFFLVSNFGVWLAWTMYPRSAAGLAECYAAGLPFYGNSLAGDLFFSALMFGSYYWLLRRDEQRVTVG